MKKKISILIFIVSKTVGYFGNREIPKLFILFCFSITSICSFKSGCYFENYALKDIKNKNIVYRLENIRKEEESLNCDMARNKKESNF